MTEWICTTCDFATRSVSALACGHWSHCPHYAKAKQDGTLPPVSQRPGTDIPYE